jgi:hypothetical protein
MADSSMLRLTLDLVRKVTVYTVSELVPMRIQKRRARGRFEKTRRDRNLGDVIDHEFMTTLDLYDIRPVRRRRLWHVLVRAGVTVPARRERVPVDVPEVTHDRRVGTDI